MANSRTQQLDDTFYALSDPTRRAIVIRLMQGEANVGELAKPFALSPAAMSKHLRVLENVGMVEQTRRGRFRQCQLVKAPLAEAADFFREYEAFWNQALDSFAEYVGAYAKRKEGET